MALALAFQKMAPTPFQGIDNGQSIIYAFVTVTPSNAPAGYVTGGDGLDFTQLGALLESGYAPLQATFWSQSAAAGHSGYQYYYRPNANPTLSNNKLQVLQSGGAGAPMQELAQGNYPAGILADTIVGLVCFVRL